MNPHRNANVKAIKIARVLHFSIRFSFTELFHSYNYFSARVSLIEIAKSVSGVA